jgi:AraC family transcriptional regulator
VETHSPVTHGATNRSVDLGDLRLTETSHAPRTRLAKHRHAFPALTFVLTGRFSEDFGRGRVHECGALSLLIKPGDAVHSNVYSEVGARSFIIECTAENELFRVLECSVPQLVRPRFVPMLLCSYRAFCADAPEQRLLAEEVVLELTREEPDLRNWRTDHRPRWLPHVEEVLREGCRRQLSLTKLAADVGIHPVYLARMFRRHHGKSVGEFMIQSRVRLAMTRLATTDDPISGIAFECGFADQSHLTRMFRREVGVPPARFRRLARPSGSEAAPRRFRSFKN